MDALPIAGVPDLMHHKYMVRDGESVWTGSTNFTVKVLVSNQASSSSPHQGIGGELNVTLELDFLGPLPVHLAGRHCTRSFSNS